MQTAIELFQQGTAWSDIQLELKLAGTQQDEWQIPKGQHKRRSEGVRLLWGEHDSSVPEKLSKVWQTTAGSVKATRDSRAKLILLDYFCTFLVGR